MTTTADPAALLREAGLRVTRPRIALLEALESHPHTDVETLLAHVRAAVGTFSTQAAYDAVSALTAAGVVRRIEPAGSSALYELRRNDNHHHLVCQRCGAIVDVACGAGHRPCLDPPDLHGYVLDEAEVTYWGLCPDCQSAALT